jgi:hypothetical protein
MINVSTATSRAFQRLDAATQLQVKAVVREHLQACVNTGAPIENLDRVFVEAIEIVRLGFKEEVYPSHVKDLKRIYEQYRSPREV